MTNKITKDHIMILSLILFGTIRTSASFISESIAQLKSLPTFTVEKEESTRLLL